MKYILTLLLFSSAATADISHSFQMKINQRGHFYKTTATSWAAAISSNATAWRASGAVDTIASGKPSQWQNFRAFYVTDTVNTTGLGDNYPDSMDVAVGNVARLDSVVFSIIAKNAEDSGGCTSKIYAYISDTCATIGYTPTLSISQITHYNQLRTAANGLPDKFDSVAVDTNAFGKGDSLSVTFAVTTRAYLDEILCRMNLGTSALAFGIWLTTCYDADQADPVSGNPYKVFVELGASPTLTFYWTEVEPDLTLPWFSGNPFNQLPHGIKPHNQ